MPRWEIQSQMTSESMSNMSDGFEAERIASMTDLVDNTGSIPHEFIAIHPTTVTFVITKAFEWLLIWFNTKYSVSFPDISCAYCGVLSLGRTICWIEACKVAQEWPHFRLMHMLNLAIHQDAKGRVAICSLCKKKRREAPLAGPWPEVLLQIPQRSKMFLSPVKLNCNVGRMQSHASGSYHNPYSTYHMLSGEHLWMNYWYTDHDRKYVSHLQWLSDCQGASWPPR